MEDRDKKLLKTYAENNMNVRETGNAVYHGHAPDGPPPDGGLGL